MREKVTESRLHFRGSEELGGQKKGSGRKGEQRWQGVHLQLAYCGMLIRPAKTSHLPPKCHILSGRARGTATGFVWLLSGKRCCGLFAFSSGNFFSVPFLPRAFFLLTFPGSVSLCPSVMLFTLWWMALFQLELFFFSSLLLAGIDYNPCNCAETRLILLKNMVEGGREEGKYRRQQLFTLM